MAVMDGADIVLQHYPAAMRKMRVAMVTETYPPEINGVAMTMGRIVAGLQARGHTVQLTTTDPAAHLALTLGDDEAGNGRGKLNVSRIDPALETAAYQAEVMAAAVPEPETWAMMLGGLAAGMQVFSLHPPEGLPAEVAKRVVFVQGLNDLQGRLLAAQAH